MCKNHKEFPLFWMTKFEKLSDPGLLFHINCKDLCRRDFGYLTIIFFFHQISIGYKLNKSG